MSPKAWAVLALVGRVAVGAAFVVSGFTKAVAPAADFAAVIDTYQLVPTPMQEPLARTLPWLELALGTFALAGLFRKQTSIGLSTMLVMFLWALGSSKLRGLDLGTCGCFGTLGPKLTPVQAMMLDSVLLALAVCIGKDREGWFSLDRKLEDGAKAPPPPPRSERRRAAA